MEFTRFVFCFFFKQRTAYELRISDWSSDVCSSDLKLDIGRLARFGLGREVGDGALEPLRKPVTFSLERPRLPAGEKPADKTADGEGNESDNKRCSIHKRNIGRTPPFWLAKNARALSRRVSFVARKSVVSGKSVSVRLDLGGRRALKKKHK